MHDDTSTATPAGHCPICGYVINRASAADGSLTAPRAGDWSVCLGCGTGFVFSTDLSLRRPKATELAAMRRDPEFQQTQRAVRALRRMHAVLN